MTESRQIDIHVPVLARVEGEGALDIVARDGHITDLRLRIFEPPRLFEKFLEGRPYYDVIDTVARICGICPVAYQMSAVQAIERAFGVEPDAAVVRLRRVLYCGEWIQSHALHIHMLAAPDFLGFPNVIAMAERYPEEVRRGLRLQDLGNRIMRVLGGRSVHPVSVCVGGFTRVPRAGEVEQLHADLEAALHDAERLVYWAGQLPLPDDQQEFISVALRHPEHYAVYSGRIVASDGLDIGIDGYPEHFREEQVPHSTALHSTFDGRPYLVGPLARLNLNHRQLPIRARQMLADIGISLPSRNMFHSVVARALEIWLAIAEARDLLADYREPESSAVPVAVRAGEACGASEAPRGLLWHHYAFDERGLVTRANIIPPTSQNQGRMEQDLRHSLEAYGLQHTDAELRLRAEMVVRNYDPCISCATHFLDLRLNRAGMGTPQ